MKNHFEGYTTKQLEQAAANQALVDGWKCDRIMEEIERRKKIVSGKNEVARRGA